MTSGSGTSSRVAWWLATWFGCGWSPQAPGTVGALGALAVALPLHYYLGWPAWWFAPLALVATPPGIWAADVAARESGRKDPGFVVVDEVVGQWLTLAGATTLTPTSWVLGFCLFRLFDIWKPFPIRRLERLPGGTGIVLDDLMAGVYGAAALWLAGKAGLY